MQLRCPTSASAHTPEVLDPRDERHERAAILHHQAVARALDANANVLPHARTFNSVEFESFVTQLTPKRFELLRLAIKRRRSIADLAMASRRDQSAVSRDVAKLQALGLVKVDIVVNPGHGQMKMVTPVATRIAIDVSL